MTAGLDLVVIGGGAAGLAAARTAARMKRHVVMVQDGPVGGDCTFTGCVPSKTFLEATAAGLAFGPAMDRVHEAVQQIAATETADVLRGEGIRLVEDRAQIVGRGLVRAGTGTYRGRHIVIATGSVPARPAIAGLDSVDVLDSDSVWNLDRPPSSILLLGGGPVGCELAQAFARCGTRVTLVEVADRLLPGEDLAAGEVLREALTAQGVAVRTAVQPERMNNVGAAVEVDLGGETVSAERVLLAVGRTPSTSGLGMESAGVRLSAAGHVVVNDRMATEVRGIWAAGDVTGRLLFTHAADEMGRAAAINALRPPVRMRVREATMPRVTFTDPEVAQVGLTETEAAVAGALVSEVPMSAVDRAVAAGRTEGFVKLICRPRARSAALGRIVGATIVAPRAGEMIHELALAVRTGMPVFRLAQTVHAYPTWSVAVRTAAAQFLFDLDGRAARPAVGRR